MYNYRIIKKVNKNIKDSPSKRILTRKDMISYILKYFVSEYKDIEIEDIKKSLESGKDNKHIKTIENKDSFIYKATINYDILFTVKVPNSNEEIGMYINIEPQGSYNISYKLIRRALYYVCRLISRQKGINFYKQDFNNIKKVYSIWLDTYSDSKRLGSINSYTIKEECLSGSYNENIKDYDLINIIIAYISNNDDYGQYQELMKLLYMLFVDTKIEPNDKLSIIKDKYVNIDIDEEIKDMCNYEEIIAYKSKEEGIQEGYNLGLNDGIIETNIKSILNCMDSLNISLDKAIEILKINDDIKDKVIESINKRKS